MSTGDLVISESDQGFGGSSDVLLNGIVTSQAADQDLKNGSVTPHEQTHVILYHEKVMHLCQKSYPTKTVTLPQR